MTTSEPLPKLSVVVVCYEMAAQIKSTLQSILPPYQRNIFIGEYEIILMDNGSAKVLDEPTQKILPNLNYILSYEGSVPAVILRTGSLFLLFLLRVLPLRHPL